MHKKKIAGNSIIGIMYRFFLLLIGFVSRKIFIMYLGEEILGLNSLYGNVLDFLNLADLGIGVAVLYLLYEPLVNNDYCKLSRIITATKKIYRIIGVIVLVLSFFLSFFIRDLIKETTYSTEFVRHSFLISAIGISFGYFFAHIRLYFQADEKLGLINIVDFATKIVVTIISLICTIVYRNYFLYLIINTLHGVLSNLSLYYLFLKKYPEINTTYKGIDEDKKDILLNLKNVIPMKLSNYVYNSTDNVIISKYIGLTTVARYSNYMTIINGIMGFEYIIGAVVASSFGKLINEDKEKKRVYDHFLVFQFVQYALVNFVTVALFLLISPFITIWIGKNMILDNGVTILLVIDFYIHSMYQPAYVMYGAAGLFKNDKIITIVSAIMNIVISIGAMHFIGLPGVILGTIITDIYIWIVRTKQMIGDYFNKDLKKYTVRMVFYTLLTVVSVGLCIYLANLITINNVWIELCVKILICLIVPNVMLVAGTFKTKEFSSIKTIISNTLQKRHKPELFKSI